MGFDHFPEEVVAFAGTLAHAGEDGEAVMGLRDIVDQFLDEDGLAHAGAAEQADLAALEVRLQQVDDLDAGEKDLLRGRKILELRRFAVDRERILPGEGAHAVDGLAHDVHDAAADLRAHRHRNRGTRGQGFHPAAQSVGGIHGDAPDRVLADVLLHLDDEGTSVRPFHFQRFMDAGEFPALFQVKMHVDDRPHHLGYLSCRTACHTLRFWCIYKDNNFISKSVTSVLQKANVPAKSETWSGTGASSCSRAR